MCAPCAVAAASAVGAPILAPVALAGYVGYRFSKGKGKKTCRKKKIHTKKHIQKKKKKKGSLNKSFKKCLKKCTKIKRKKKKLSCKIKCEKKEEKMFNKNKKYTKKR